jgi:hypothetical protein
MLPTADISTVPKGASMEDKMDIVLSLLFKQSKQLSLYEEKISALEMENKKLNTSVNTLNRSPLIILFLSPDYLITFRYFTLKK